MCPHAQRQIIFNVVEKGFAIRTRARASIRQALGFGKGQRAANVPKAISVQTALESVQLVPCQAS